jgi:hypothetical protein
MLKIAGHQVGINAVKGTEYQTYIERRKVKTVSLIADIKIRDLVPYKKEHQPKAHM